jgi:hypothetical protein
MESKVCIQFERGLYDRSTKPIKSLSTGQTIRLRHGNRWIQEIVKKKVDNRSYIVETEDGYSYRRNRRHLLKSNEQPFPTIDFSATTSQNQDSMPPMLQIPDQVQPDLTQ